MLALRTMRILAAKMVFLFWGPKAEACFEIDTPVASPDPLTSPMSEVFKTGKATLALNPKPALGFATAANTEMLPESKPRALREHFIVPSIGGRDVAWAKRPNIRRFEHFLKLLDLVNDAFNVHASQSSRRKRGAVNLKQQLAGDSSSGDQINGKASQPMPAFVVLASHRSQTRSLVLLRSRSDHRQALIAVGQAGSDSLQHPCST